MRGTLGTAGRRTSGPSSSHLVPLDGPFLSDLSITAWKGLHGTSHHPHTSLVSYISQTTLGTNSVSADGQTILVRPTERTLYPFRSFPGKSFTTSRRTYGSWRCSCCTAIGKRDCRNSRVHRSYRRERSRGRNFQFWIRSPFWRKRIPWTDRHRARTTRTNSNRTGNRPLDFAGTEPSFDHCTPFFSTGRALYRRPNGIGETSPGTK